MKLAHLLLLLGATLFTSNQVRAGAITRDNDQTHGHSPEYFQKLKSNYKDGITYVHLISHTHDDVGWLKTVDEYYSGTQQNVVKVEVHMILDTVVDELLKDPKKRFTYVEMKFLSLWWSEQTDAMKASVRQLVQEGRLEIVNAGWSMHDEACPHYEDMINNMMKGHEWLLQELGVKPRIGWHVDPFGHSNANPRLFADMGFDAWFFARLDFQDKAKRLDEKAMQWVWRPMFDHLGVSTQIFTHAMQDHYCYPSGFDYDDRFNGDDPVVTDTELETYNADEKVQEMLDYATHMSQHYQGNHLMVTMGCDFTYPNARMNFMSMDRLIDYFNSHVENYQLVYSTPGIYLDSVKAQNLTFPVKYDDMFPYADGDRDFWTGYFTSRANSKKQVRDASSNLHGSTKLAASKVLDQTVSDDLINQIMTVKHKMLDALGIAQHHDGVSGTAKQHVADDYNYRLYTAMEANNVVYSNLIEQLLESQTQLSAASWQWCERTNGTYLDCPINTYGTQSHIVVAYNPSYSQQYFMKLKVQFSNYKVSTWDSGNVKWNDITDSAEVICAGRTIKQGTYIQDCEMHIEISTPGAQISVIKLDFDGTAKSLEIQPDAGATHQINGFQETLVYSKTDPVDGVVFDIIKSGKSGKTYSIAFDLRAYDSFAGGDNNCPSGAYIFKPDTNQQDSLKYADMFDIQSYTGKIVSEIHMKFQNADYTRQALVRARYYSNSPVSEWDVLLYGIPDNKDQGLEVTVNFKSYDIDNKNTFYTDSNGLEMQKRVLNFRPTWDFSTTEKSSGNYYPINSAIAIVDEDKKLQMTVMNDRSQGGSVLQAGRIEFMQNRRMFFDDWRGVDEALNETDQLGNPINVPATYRIQFLERDNDYSYQRNAQMWIDQPLQYFFSRDYKVNTKATVQPYKEFRPTINLLSNDPAPFKYELFPLQRNQILIRIENVGDKFDTDYRGENINGTAIAVDLMAWAGSFFNASNSKPMSVSQILINELALSGNQLYSDMVKTKTDWKTTAPGDKDRQPKGPADVSPTNIKLQQQRIRLFNITYVITKQEQEKYVHKIESSAFLQD